MSFSNALSTGAFVVSLVALLITGLQWRDNHNGLLLSMTPTASFEIAADPDDLPVGISLSNAGPGPAVVRSVTYYVDNKAVGGVDDLVRLKKLENIQYYDLEDGDTMAVGSPKWLLEYVARAHVKKTETEVGEFVDLLGHLGVEVQFCPVLHGKCSTKCSVKGRCK